MSVSLFMGIFDALSERTGYVAIEDIVARPHDPDVVTLPLPGYSQLNSYVCGAVAGYSIVKLFHPEADFDAFYQAVEPCPNRGSTTEQVLSAFEQFGVKFRRGRLGFAGIKRRIDQGHPILVSIRRPNTGHWVVVYGYGVRPDRVFLTSNILPYFNRNQYSWEKFEQLRYPKGNSVACWKA